MITHFPTKKLSIIFACVKRKTVLIMLRFLLFAVAGILLTSCSKSYDIEGKTSVSCLDGRMFYLRTFDEECNVIDSAEIVHGHFNMNGKLDTTTLAMAFMDNRFLMPVVLEDGKTKIDITLEKMTVSGTPLNDLMYSFFDQKRNYEKKFNDIDIKVTRMIMDGYTVAEARTAVSDDCDSLANSYGNMIETFITNNFENVLSKCIFLMLYGHSLSPEKTASMKKILEKAPEHFRNDIQIKEYTAIAE